MMTLQSVLTIAALAIGFVAAIFFCIGAVTSNPEQIALRSASIVGFNPFMMRSLSAQRAQYVVGAILLVFSFGLQVVAVLTSPTIVIWLPPALQSACALLVSILVLVSLIAWLAMRNMATRTEKAAQESLQALMEKQRTGRKS